MSDTPESGEKTHEATPKKLVDARKKGQIPKSADLSASTAYLGLILAISLVGPTSLLDAASKLTQFMSQPASFTSTEHAFENNTVLDLVRSAAISSLLPFFAIPALAVFLSLVAQRAITFAPSKITPKLSKISPATAAKNKFGASGLFEFFKSTSKLIIVGFVVVWFLNASLPEMLQLVGLQSHQLAGVLGDYILSFLWIIFVMSLAIGAMDYLWQSADHLRKHRMTRKEVEDESKESEGDPRNKQARRQRGFEIAMNQMLADVPDAAVVIVNPTHYAIALKWSAHSLAAPVCVAKGTDEIAARIREKANDFSIPIHRDPPTARSLFDRIEIGQEVWPDDYLAVAAAIRFAQSVNSSSR
jgi:flagellar biosynthetic protein FlhB